MEPYIRYHNPEDGLDYWTDINGEWYSKIPASPGNSQASSTVHVNLEKQPDLRRFLAKCATGRVIQCFDGSLVK